jgi:lipoyl-dependent peroxiredoxin
MDSIKPLFTAVGSVTGGRNGHGEAEDHSVSVNLSVPKAMGGPGRPNTTTPEHLFAVGYAACFGGALDLSRSRRRGTPKAQPSPAACRSGRATRAGSASR